mmetsp:Transcript_66177/g.123526  ORF Transcript_66177/g.123526 Transcript_66177/m.123526 type:complete len:306 (+) Transcript_66177:92-1009(+)
MNDTGSDDDEIGYEAVMGFHLVFLIVLAYVIRRYYCKRRAAGTEGGVAGDALQVVQPEEVQSRKRRDTAYALFFCGGLVGIHHYYLDRPIHGLFATWTLNFCGIGAIVDFFRIPKYVDSFNQKRTPPLGPTEPEIYQPPEPLLYDRSHRKVFIHFPLLVVLFIGTIVPAILFTPALLQRCGIVDIDRLAAQTQKNPYDILELGGGATLSEAKAAYRKQSLKWHPDRNPGCGKECDDKMAEITKAFDLIKKKQGVAPDRTFKGRLKALALDWWNIFVAMFVNDPSGFSDPFGFSEQSAGERDDSEL